MKRLLTSITAALVASAHQVGLMSPTIIQAPKWDPRGSVEGWQHVPILR